MKIKILIYGLTNLANNSTLFISLCNQIKKSNPNFTLQKAKLIFKNGFKKLFKNKDVDITFLDALEEHSNRFVLNPVKFYKEFLNFSLKYYMQIDKFKYFLITNETEILILSEEQIKSLDLSELGLKIKSFPSFTPGAGTQRKIASVFN